jgi:poly(A) polymerase Pap1
VSAEESLRQAEELMERLEETRTRLEETTDPETAIEVLSELAEIAREIEAALSQAKREADAGA